MTISVGVIGGGVNSAVGRAHLSALSLDGNWSIESGFFSRSDSVNLKSKDLWGAKRIYNSVEEMVGIESDLVDVFLLLSPTPHHFNDLRLLLSKGCRVICEKALTHSLETTRQVVDFMRNKNSKPIFNTFNYTGYPMVRELQSKILNGTFGDVFRIEVSMPQEGFAIDDPVKIGKIQDWRKQDFAIPTVALDLGVHVHNLVHFLTGRRLKELVSSIGGFGKLEEISDTFLTIGRLEGSVDTQVLLNYGKTFLGHTNGLSVNIFGTRGSAVWYQQHPDEYWYSDSRGQRQLITYASKEVEIATQSRYSRFKVGHPTGFIEAFANLYFDFYLALSNDNYIESGLVPTEKAALLGISELDASVRSAKNQSWIEIDS